MVWVLHLWLYGFLQNEQATHNFVLWAFMQKIVLFSDDEGLIYCTHPNHIYIYIYYADAYIDGRNQINKLRYRKLDFPRKKTRGPPPFQTKKNVGCVFTGVLGHSFAGEVDSTFLVFAPSLETTGVVEWSTSPRVLAKT